MKQVREAIWPLLPVTAAVIVVDAGQPAKRHKKFS